jgi:uncharacterized protein YbaR (Trm112 family)
MALSMNLISRSLDDIISKDLVHILVCPVCKGALETGTDAQSVLCRSCGLKFPIRDGIPIMLVSEAGSSDE